MDVYIIGWGDNREKKKKKDYKYTCYDYIVQ